MKVLSVVTKSGDKGLTHGPKGMRVLKNDAFIVMQGSLDETNCSIGMFKTLITDIVPIEEIESIQQKLYNAGATLFLAGIENEGNFAGENITTLEEKINLMESELEPLKSFIMPGGDCGLKEIHMARAICRRCETTLQTLHAEENENIVIFINRLSDYLFILARFVDHRRKKESNIYQTWLQFFQDFIKFQFFPPKKQRKDEMPKVSKLK